MTTLDERISEICGAGVTAMARLGGGDVADAFRVTLADGRSVFAKTKAEAPENFFTTEANGLRWLSEVGAGSVAQVIGVSDDEPACLVLEWIEPGGSRSAEHEAGFGRDLASIHRFGADHFGRADRATTGSLGLPNDPCDTWAEFYAERRLRPLVEIAGQRQALEPATIAGVLQLCERLDEFGAADEAPSRLHGDLWAGNRVVAADGRSWLIDPAAHGGHREFDLGMMRLFGGFAQECFDAYDEAYPLAAGWEQRVPLHHLAPLIVHAIKFGDPYGNAVTAALAQLS